MPEPGGGARAVWLFESGIVRATLFCGGCRPFSKTDVLRESEMATGQKLATAVAAIGQGLASYTIEASVNLARKKQPYGSR